MQVLVDIDKYNWPKNIKYKYRYLIFALFNLFIMPKISQLYIYPVKSLGGISLQQAQVTSRGLQHDRRWMLIDESNVFLSQRKFPQMALFKLSLLEEGLEVIHASSLSRAVIPFIPQTQEHLSVKIWDDECIGTRVSPALDEWFSNLLSFNCRLVYMGENSLRPVDPNYAGPQHITSFADAYPMLLISEASLNDLNARLKEPIGMERFRPNMVITNTEPYQEDALQHFTAAGINFYSVKPCARCVMIGVDQQTATTGTEPLKTLSGYRKANNKIYFGQNLIHDGEGVLTVGDDLSIKQLGNKLQLNKAVATI
jgi:hypothetical protein